MLVEVHIIQNFAPSNLNRDDTGSPKDCEFGGYRRARISSQCLKRAMRREFDRGNLIPAPNRAQRTKRLVDSVATSLSTDGRTLDEARQVVRAALESVGIKVVDDRPGATPENKTQYLLFLGESEITRLVQVCDEHWPDLIAGGSATGGGNVSARAAKQAARQAAPADVKKAVEALLDGGRAADVALFGRMLADLPSKNVDAASQVAHAISTNKLTAEFDYYTAVDDLKPEDTAGADMIGTVEFNSACFYRYANLDVDQLRTNLDGDAELTVRTIRAFVQATIDAIPTGKQNSMAAQNPPSFVMAVVRETAPVSLANAFLAPVRPDEREDLVQGSIRRLDEYWQRLHRMYGDEMGVHGVFIASTEDGDGLQLLKPTGTRREVIEATLSAVMASGGVVA